MAVSIYLVHTSKARPTKQTLASFMEDPVVNELAGDEQQQHARPVYINWLRRYKYNKQHDPHRDMRSVLLVVSALIATITFQAGISPPGGVWQDHKPGLDGHLPGSAIYSSHKKPFYVFLVFNTLALSSSISVIISLTFMFPFSVETLITTISMIITYGSSIFGITPHHGDYKFRYLLITAAFPFVARLVVQLYRYVMHSCTFERRCVSGPTSPRKPTV